MRTQEERMQSQAQRGRETIRLVPAEVPQEVSLGQQPQRRLREWTGEDVNRDITHTAADSDSLRWLDYWTIPLSAPIA